MNKQQPPAVSKPFLRDQIHALKERAEQMQSSRATSHDKDRSRQIDYVQAIRKLMLSLPLAVRSRPWTMDELVQRLPGRYREHAHTALIGLALRELGFTQKRCWKKSGRNRRYWLPPENMKETVI